MTALTFDRDFDVKAGAVEQVSPLVRRVVADNPGPYTFKGTSTYIVGHGHVAIVDPGPDEQRHLDALLAAIDGETVSHIIVTHSHADHSPLAKRLKEITGARTHAQGIVAPAGEAGLRLDASIDHGFIPDVTLDDGDVVAGKNFTLEAVATPGHMSNHMCFALREEKTLFAGDHVMAWATSVIAPPDGHMGQYFASLQKLTSRDDVLYLPGHGPARRDPLPLVRGLIAHRKMREGAILRRIADGDRTVAAIVAAIYTNVDPGLHGAAALSTQAHVDHLVEQGRVRETAGFYEAA